MNSVQIPCLTEEQSANFEISKTDHELIFPDSTKNNSPSNSGPTKIFMKHFGKNIYETFWDDLKKQFVLVIEIIS